MPPAALENLVDFLHRLAPAHEAVGQSDAVLLRRYAQQRDEMAFAVLVQRHGPLVLGVCRRWLRHTQDIEDAFQATFLVLSRRAGQIGRPDRLGNWLFGVALRTARKLRHREGRRPMDPLPDVLPAPCDQEVVHREMLGCLDEELARLPERDRLALALCCLEGRSREEAACEMGVSPGAVKGLLERGRQRLRDRLARRGLGTLAALLCPIDVPLHLRLATIESGLTFVGGGCHTTPAILLAQKVIREMFSFRWKILAACVLVGIVCSGLGLALQPAAPEQAPPRSIVRLPAEPKEEPVNKKPLDLVHKANVRRVAFTPDGKTIITTTNDGTVVFWDALTGKERARWAGHKKAIIALAVSSDGKTIATGDEGDTILVREMTRGKVIWKHTRDALGVASLAFSPDSKTLYGVVGLNNQLLRWNAQAGRALESWRPADLKESLRSVAVSGDGKRIIVGGFAALNEGTNWSTLRVLDAESGKTLFTFNGTKSKLNDLTQKSSHTAPLAVAQDGKTWAGAGSDNVIYIDKGDSISAHKKAITALTFVDGGKVLVSASLDGTIKFWNRKSLDEVARLSVQGEVLALAASPDGKRLAWAVKGVVKVRDVAGLRRDHALKK